jgi:hypothetical protein
MTAIDGGQGTRVTPAGLARRVFFSKTQKSTGLRSSEDVELQPT